MPLIRDSKTLAIVLPSWVGDCVMATPVLRAARLALPSTRIVGVMRRAMDEVLRGVPWLDELIVCDMKGVLGPWRMANAIRRAIPPAEPGANGAVLLLPNSFRSALGARLSGARTRIGYARDNRGWLLTNAKVDGCDKRKPVPAVEYYAALAEFAFGDENISRRVELVVTDAERVAAEKLLRDVQQPFALLNPGANRADKRWPAERFAAVADSLVSSHHTAIVISGSPGERDVLEAVQRSAKVPMINLAQRGATLGSLKAVIQQAALVITNDTGPRHIAAALGTPVVTLFGPTDHRWTTLPSVREHILVAEPFLPEELVADQFAKVCAIEKISVKDVLLAAAKLLDELQHSERADVKSPASAAYPNEARNDHHQ